MENKNIDWEKIDDKFDEDCKKIEHLDEQIKERRQEDIDLKSDLEVAKEAAGELGIKTVEITGAEKRG